jgi:hypothetical protein
VYASGGHADGSGGSPTVTFNGSTSTLQNVWIRGSYVGVSFTGTGSSNSLKGSRVNGIRTIQVSGQHYVTIDNNDITANYYATSGDFAYSNYISHDFSEWEYAPKATTSPYCMANYLFSPVMKHIGGEGQGIEDMLGIYDLGGGNSDVTVSNNHIHGYDSGVFIGWKGASSNWETFGNRFENMTSNGINFGKYAVNAKFHDNSSGRINEHVRFQSLWNDPTPRSVYIYRNQFWFPSNVGQDFYFHYGPKVTTTAPAAYIYHNSFQGGNTVFGFGGGDPSTPQLGVPGFHAWNNVFSGLTRMWIDWTANSGADSAHWGRFGYSWMGTAGGTYGTVAWTGETKTYVTNGNMWPGTTPPKSWAPTGSAVGTAVDCSPGTWTLGSTTFGPMPGCTAGTTNMGAQ